MKYLFVFVLFFVGCKPLHDVERNRTNQSVRLEETGKTKIERPGEIIVLPMPMTPNERPRDTTITSKGKKGTVVTTSYDKDGFVSGQMINTPGTIEESEYDRKMEGELKTLELRRKLDIEVINAAGKWASIILVPAFAFFALAWYLRGKS